MPGTHGPIILDLSGLDLSLEEREILQHPLVGGVILFSRNYASLAQLTELCSAIRAIRPYPFLISVDQEGGRVQRFRQEFTRIPPMRQLGDLYDISPGEALSLAKACGWVMAAELFAAGVDLSFAPVLDLDSNNQSVIGDRAFHSDPLAVTMLASAFIEGMSQVGMKAVGKHFPGHGHVTLDSHQIMPVDDRTYEQVKSMDLQPFMHLVQTNRLNAIMPAHILFPAVDDKPVGFSQHWLSTVLRKELQFSGVIVSDDLSMQGAAFAGDHLMRAKLALSAGCDLLLICNDRAGAFSVLEGLSADECKVTDQKMQQLQCNPLGRGEFRNTRDWEKMSEQIGERIK